MSNNNHGTYWYIDHIVPLKFDNPTIDQVIERLHYTNTQALTITDNLHKSNT